MIEHFTKACRNDNAMYLLSILIIGMIFYEMETHDDVHTFIYNRCCSCLLMTLCLTLIFLLIYYLKFDKLKIYIILCFTLFSMLVFQQQFLLIV